jgi:NodT family efflux transporter outer membrane factor (OMF) lipoprotein
MRCLILISTLSLFGCAATREPLVPAQDVPPSWRADEVVKPLPENWLDTLHAPYLTEIVEQALASNYELTQRALQVEIANERVKILRADRLPSLNLSLSGERFRPGGDFSLIAERYDASANLGFELDLWGKLSDAQRSARLDLAAEEMSYLDAERRLVAQVVSTTFNLISSAALQDLFNQRLDNLAEGLDVIEKGYRSGLNEALDVYLAQTTVEQERANVANQRQVSFEASTRLELLLAKYPDAGTTVQAPLPELRPLPDIGLPSQLLTRRPDIQQSWLTLLSADAALAAAHKDRFPSLDLTGSLRDTASAYSRLLDGGTLGFSAAASLFQPLFQGGRLKALEAQARLRTEQAEQAYLQTVYAAFAEVENELSRAVSLKERFEAFLQAEANAEAALRLATDQYQRGLVVFTTVLEAQRRAFDAQTTVVQLRNQMLQSRVALLLALGGNY